MRVIDELFGDLRSMLQHPAVSATALLDLLVQAVKTDRETFQAVWVPYLSGFELPELTFHNPRDVEEVLPLLPPHTPCVVDLSFGHLHHHQFQNFLNTVSSHTGIRRLILSHNPDLDNHALYDLAATKNFINLECVEFSNTGVDHEGVTHLITSEHLPSLVELEIHDGQGKFGLPALQQLVRLPQLSRLRTLKWWSDALGVQGAQLIAQCDALHHLESLWFWNNRIGDDGLEAIARSPHLGQLKDLRIQNNAIGNRGLRALNRAPLLQQLHTLELGSNRIDDAPLIDLINALQTATLRRLNLCELCTVDVMACLASSPQLAHLTFLDVDDCDLYDEGIAPLWDAPSMFNLTTFNLELNHLTDDTLIELASAPHMHKLRILNLADNQFGDSGARALANSPYLHNLTNLDFSINQVTDIGAIALAQSPQLASLEEFLMYRNALSESGEEALKRSPYLREGIELWL